MGKVFLSVLHWLSSRIFFSLIFCNLNMIFLGMGFWVVFFFFGIFPVWCSQLLESVVWSLSLILESSPSSLFLIFLPLCSFFYFLCFMCVCAVLSSSAATAAAKSLQSCPTLCDPIDSSPSGSTVLGILQARTLEWVAISFSNAWKWKVKGKLLSPVWLSATPWTAAHQASPSMGLSRQEYWCGVPLPSPSSSVMSNSLWVCIGYIKKN